jgi:hypothetical protein
VLAHVTLADLMLLEGSDGLREEWTRQARARWAGYRARTAEARGDDGDDGAWLDGDAAAAIACDAMVVPVVTGEINPAVFADLVRLCAELDKLSRRGISAQDSEDGSPAVGTVISREALEQAIVGKAVDLLSGPGGLASFVRQHQLGERLAGPSLPLDIGASASLPGSIRNLVHLRDRHYRFHHQIAIHRRGWTLVLNPDGTTTAWNKDKSKVLHSHDPPARTG